MKPGPPSYTVVGLDERWQVLYWTTALDCEEMDLRAAVAEVGDNAAMVREHVSNAKMLGRYRARPSGQFAL